MSYYVSWITSGTIANVKIEYSIDNGFTWLSTPITPSTPNDGALIWTLPSSPSTNCLVKVSDISDANIYDISDSTFSIVTLAPAFIQLSKTNLCFGSVTGNQSTQGQSVIISNKSEGTLNWTATPLQSWINVSPGSGMGTGTINVGVKSSNLGTGKYTGLVTVSDPNASNNPLTINVTLNIYASEWTSSPIGFFDTPLDGTTRIEGSVPVTGWALDDIGVESVKIYRDPVDGV
jgi:hypothetical protein